MAELKAADESLPDTIQLPTNKSASSDHSASHSHETPENETGSPNNSNDLDGADVSGEKPRNSVQGDEDFTFNDFQDFAFGSPEDEPKPNETDEPVYINMEKMKKIGAILKEVARFQQAAFPFPKYVHY